MFALHWICALTLALVSCLCAYPVQRNDELLEHISKLNTITANCPDDMRLYSPFDITKECMSSALNCTIDELSVFKEECEIPEDDVELIDNVILAVRDINTASSSPNCSCEMYDQTDVKKFLDNMKRLVQQHDSMNRQLTDP